MLQTKKRHLFALTILPLFMAGCSDSDSDSNDETAEETSDINTSDSPLQALLFEDGAVTEITTVSCTLSTGEESECYEITIPGEPTRDIGPFCPPSITSTADEGGIWMNGTGDSTDYYELDGNFFTTTLPTLYAADYPARDGEADWILYDTSTGDINITDTQAACTAAADPDVPEEYYNYCVECALEHTVSGAASPKTFLIPINPVQLDTPTALNGTVGISLDGVILEGAAPVDAILSHYTIAAFDDCGGHVNPYEGYHYHTSTGRDGCAGEAQEDGHADLIGFALDGFPIYAELNSLGLPDYEELDECRGIEVDDGRGYRYYTTGIGENAHIGCYRGATVASDDEERPPGGGPPPGAAG